MRNNKAILDEAARSVRRTFIGSIAGTFGMMAVVGAAGAYGMPARMSAQSLTEAFASLHAKFSPMVERMIPVVEQARAFAGNMTRGTAVMPAPDDSVVLPVPPMIRQTPAVAPAPVVAPPAATVEAAPAPQPATETASIPPATAEPSDPVPALAATNTADSTPPDEAAAPAEAVAPPAVFTTASIPPMPELTPAPEIAAAPAAAARPDEVQKAIAEPKTVWVQLPRPKAPLTPAQLLDLHGKDYEKAERCLAKAVYFEARNQATRGQMAVAQVVMNRVFSPYYPNDVCSVVYQNAHRHLSCQFTFACDGKSGAIRERGAWARAQRIARQTLDAKIWLPDVAKATHYHAAYVHPYWVREMRVMVRFGLHTFYRPRQWGDGSNEPSWGAGAARKGRVL